MEDAYLKSKYAPPYYRQRTIERSSAIELFNRERPDMAYICAPAGYGKTTLGTQLRRSLIAQKHVVTWINCEAEDGEKSQLLASIFNAFREADCDVLSESRALVTPGRDSRSEKALTMLANDLDGQGAEHYLFLDNFQDALTEDALQVVTRLVSTSGSKLKVVCLSRKPLSLVRHRQNGSLKRLDFDASMLQFSFAEASAFLHERLGKLDIDADFIRLLYETTEGWISALEWAVRKLASQDLDMAQTDWLLYDPEDLVAQFPLDFLSDIDETLRQFLLQTSVVESFNADLASALTGNRSCDQLIARVGNENAFLLPVDNESGWFRYHTLFLSTLRSELLKAYVAECANKANLLTEIDDGALDAGSNYDGALERIERPKYDLYDLHHRAGNWYLAAGITEQALKHYLNVKDLASAKDLLEKSAQALLEEGKLHTLIGWTQKLPLEAYIARPRLKLCMGWAYTLTCQMEPARAIIRALEELEGTGEDVLPDELQSLKAAQGVFADDTRPAAAMGKSWDRSGDAFSIAAGCNSIGFSKIIAGQYEEAREIVGWVDQKPKIKTLFMPYIFRQSVRALSYAFEGRFDECNKVARAALIVAEQKHGRRSAAAAVIMANLSDGYYEQDRLTDLRALISHRFDVINESVYPDALIRAYISGAKTYWALGEIDRSVNLLDQLHGYGDEHGHARVVAASLAEKMRQALAAHQVNRARDLMARLDGLLPEDAQLSFDLQGELTLLNRLAHVRLDIYESNHHEACDQLDQLIERYSTVRRRRLLAKLKLLRATAKLKLGNYAEALEDFSESLTIGISCGLKRSYMDDRDCCQSLLKQFTGSEHLSSEKQTYLSELLGSDARDSNGSGPASSVSAQSAAAGLKISPKEGEILGYLTQGLTNKHIALAMNVSPETIRWHMKNLFSKLEVNSRHDAVSRAQTLGIV